MQIHVVSDVHGQAAALVGAGVGADLFVCLGDLILYLDYEDPSQGIYAELFGEQHSREYIQARTAGRFEEARELSATAWAGLGIVDPRDRRAAMETHIRRQYSQMFAAMPEPALLTYGNVDLPMMWPDFMKPGHQVVDGESVEWAGLRLGFVGGGLFSPMRTPYELDPEVYAATLDKLGPVDILFTHIPPKMPELNYDVVARRFETGSSAINQYIERVQPKYHLFGHVHQPLHARARIGKTECMNVGHFNARKKPFVLKVDVEDHRG
ncbi:MAG: metallophosphoesterase [Actinomycetota bacterium]|nr:metallophosphoesterase [Actinomycetota bacterium]MDP2289035.1 metallophosphoesterase [Actinomycetota bacterium]